MAQLVRIMFISAWVRKPMVSRIDHIKDTISGSLLCSGSRLSCSSSRKSCGRPWKMEECHNFARKSVSFFILFFLDQLKTSLSLLEEPYLSESWKKKHIECLSSYILEMPLSHHYSYALKYFFCELVSFLTLVSFSADSNTFFSGFKRCSI